MINVSKVLLSLKSIEMIPMAQKISRKVVERRTKRAKRVGKTIPLGLRIGAAATAVFFVRAEMGHMPHFQGREPIPITRIVSAGEMPTYQSSLPTSQRADRFPFHQPMEAEGREEREGREEHLRRGREEHIHPKGNKLALKNSQGRYLTPLSALKPNVQRTNQARMSRGIGKHSRPRM